VVVAVPLLAQEAVVVVVGAQPVAVVPQGPLASRSRLSLHMRCRIPFARPSIPGLEGRHMIQAEREPLWHRLIHLVLPLLRCRWRRVFCESCCCIPYFF
jgi:hypothetical protein